MPLCIPKTTSSLKPYYSYLPARGEEAAPSFPVGHRKEEVLKPKPAHDADKW